MKTLTLTLFLAVAGLATASFSSADDSCGGGSPCCSQCGCHNGLVPQCHVYCEMKKVTEYRYCCVCDAVAIPGRSPCSNCGKCGECGGCGCDCCSPCVPVECKEIHKLVKIPVVKYVPVKKCRIDWVCPQCNCCTSCGAPADSAPGRPEAAPTDAAPEVPHATDLPKAALNINGGAAQYYASDVAAAMPAPRPVAFDAPLSENTNTATRLTFPVK